MFLSCFSGRIDVVAPFSTFFDDYFEKNQRLLGLSQSVRKRALSKGDSSTALAEPPVYAANLDGSLLSDECREFNLNALGTALDHLRPTIPGVNTPYRYFGMKGTSSAWHFEVGGDRRSECRSFVLFRIKT